jgi:hypothetical protein
MGAIMGAIIGARSTFVAGTGMSGLMTGAGSVIWGASIAPGIAITSGEAGFGFFADDASFAGLMEAQCAGVSRCEGDAGRETSPCDAH